MLAVAERVVVRASLLVLAVPAERPRGGPHGDGTAGGGAGDDGGRGRGPRARRQLERRRPIRRRGRRIYHPRGGPPYPPLRRGGPRGGHVCPHAASARRLLQRGSRPRGRRRRFGSGVLVDDLYFPRRGPRGTLAAPTRASLAGTSLDLVPHLFLSHRGLHRGLSLRQRALSRSGDPHGVGDVPRLKPFVHRLFRFSRHRPRRLLRGIVRELEADVEAPLRAPRAGRDDSHSHRRRAASNGNDGAVRVSRLVRGGHGHGCVVPRR
mmetsp:Transcript_11375/g.52848  ORF Transcript_11375/g.52848 Transcript_11375/m.52848 type:complete len:265 (+) Transcript_11375:2473-3267(+)